MRPVNDPFVSPLSYVDRELGQAYQTVRYVAQNMASVEAVAAAVANLEDVSDLAEAVSAAQTAANKALEHVSSSSTNADRAEVAAALAESVAGPTYASTALGLAATSNGQAFAVDNGDGTVTIYLNEVGVAVEQRKLATSLALASALGWSLVGTSDGTLEEYLADLVDAKATAAAIGITGTAENLGAFAGNILADDLTVKGALQGLETALESVATSVTTKAKAAALGISGSAEDMGSYSGSILSGNRTVKVNIQELATALEARAKTVDLASTEDGKGIALLGAKLSDDEATARTAEDFLRELPVSIENYVHEGDAGNYSLALGRALDAGRAHIVFPDKEDPYIFTTDLTKTLTRDTIINLNGQDIVIDGATISLKGVVVANGRTLTQNAARYATSIEVDSTTGIQAGDLVLIATSHTPSSDWSDTKKDCVRIREVEDLVLHLDEGLNFHYNTADAGLEVIIYRPSRLTLIRPKAELIGDDAADIAAELTRKMFYFEGLAGVTITEPNLKGSYPFNRSENIYWNGLQFYYCVGISIQSPTYEALSYGAGAYGCRNITETNIRARYMHHAHLDMGGWSSGYRFNGLQSSDCYQALNTHACFDSHAENFNCYNDMGLSNWRTCGGSLRTGYIQSSVDDTAEAAQYQNTTPRDGTTDPVTGAAIAYNADYDYRYINQNADFSALHVEFDMPSRIDKSPFAVKFGRHVHIEGVKASSFASSADAAGNVELTTFGPGNLIGDNARPTPSPTLVKSTGTRVYLPPRLDAYLDSAIYHINPRIQLIDQSERKLRCYGSVIRKYAGGTFDCRLHINPFAGIDATFVVGKLTLRASLQHQSAGLFSTIEQDYDFAAYLGGGAFIEFLTTPVSTRGPATGATGADVVLALTNPTLTFTALDADNYIDFKVGLSASTGVTSPSYGLEYELRLEETYT